MGQYEIYRYRPLREGYGVKILKLIDLAVFSGAANTPRSAVGLTYNRTIREHKQGDDCIAHYERRFLPDFGRADVVRVDHVPDLRGHVILGLCWHCKVSISYRVYGLTFPSASLQLTRLVPFTFTLGAER